MPVPVSGQRNAKAGRSQVSAIEVYPVGFNIRDFRLTLRKELQLAAALFVVSRAIIARSVLSQVAARIPSVRRYGTSTGSAERKLVKVMVKVVKVLRAKAVKVVKVTGKGVKVTRKVVGNQRLLAQVCQTLVRLGFQLGP